MLNVIFDATHLCHFFKKTSSRSGFFVVSKKILDELLQRKDVNVSLFFSPECMAEGIHVSRNLYPHVRLAQKTDLIKWIYPLNLLMWKMHGKLYKHSCLRKPFALGIVVSQWFSRIIMNRKYDRDVFLSAEFFFSPVNKISNVVRLFPHIKPYVLLHDAIPILFPSLSNGTVAKEICKSTEVSDGIFYNSVQTKNDFEQLFPILKSCDGCVISLAAAPDYRQIRDESSIFRVRSKYGIPGDKGYIFSLCSLAPHKNLVRNLRSFVHFIEKHNINDLIWVIGGGCFDEFEKELRKQGVSLNTHYSIHIGYVDDEDLPVLYSNAEWFVYTSQYEGFGLPPLEAMQCGCPVITSNSSSLPEVVGDAGIMIDWDSDEQHIAAYEKYYFDRTFREICGQRGLERSKLFSWEKTVDKIVKTLTREYV